MTDIKRAQVYTAFRRQYGEEPHLWVRSPGRVNLIGEHTDYNDGFVMPIAIERQVVIAAKADMPTVSATRLENKKIRIYSVNLREQDSFSPRRIRHARGWRDYGRGVAWALQEAGYPIQPGALALASDVPLGAGLSSSAAFEVGIGWTLALLGGFEVDRARLAKLMQRAENHWVGVASGIMDQFICALGQADHALLIDTRDLSYRAVPLPKGVSVVIADTNVKRGLVTSEYNARRAETAEAARVMGVKSLRDINGAGFETAAAGLSDLLRRRARHVVGENERVLQAARALEVGDLATVGHLMNESHRSLRDDYAVSHPNLDRLVEMARRAPGVYGARMTGAGFGGATVSLVADGAVADFEREVKQAYSQATGQPPPIYVTRAMDGVGYFA